MRRTLLLLTMALAPVATTAQEPAKPLQVCLLSGCNTYHSEESLHPFQKWLVENYNVRCTRVIRTATNDLPGLEELDDCDVAFVFIKRMELEGKQLEQFKKYVTSGRPVVAVRTASHAVQTWLEFDREVLGGNYQGHQPVGPITKIDLAERAGKHPILTGVTLSEAGESLHKNAGHAADIHVLLTGTIPNQPSEALVWTRDYKKGRVFYTSLGAKETFEKPDFRRMLANALFWTADRDPEAKQP